MRLFKRDLLKMTDESLMGCIQGGDIAVLDDRYDRYNSRLLHYFHRMLNRDADKAQGFLHDLFVKIVERPSAFDTRQSFTTWIFTVAHNVCKNEYRRLEVQTRETTVEQIRMDRHAGAEDIETSLDNRAFKQTVLDALDDLEPSHRTTFLLRYQEDLSIREISDILECAEGTTKSRLHYVTKRLSNQLQEMNPFAADHDNAFDARLRQALDISSPDLTADSSIRGDIRSRPKSRGSIGHLVGRNGFLPTPVGSFGAIAVEAVLALFVWVGTRQLPTTSDVTGSYVAAIDTTRTIDSTSLHT